MRTTLLCLWMLFPLTSFAQATEGHINERDFRDALLLHRELVSIPNLPENRELMLKNIRWAAKQYGDLGFATTLLASDSHPILLAGKVYDPNFKTILFYFHIDGQPVNPETWDQEDPFTPVLKERKSNGRWQVLNWNALDGEVNDEWRIFARSAADDKAPIVMFLTALKVLKERGDKPRFNIKIIFDPEEEYGSRALLSTLDQYQHRYASDYFIVMDGPAHDSNQPTITFGCRGIATFTLTTFGSALPQHSGHFGNYVPNPIFRLANLLSSMKDDNGRVLIKDYYDGIEIDPNTQALLQAVPFDERAFNNKLGIYASETVGENYQESLQYPSLNVRQIGTSWTGDKPKTVIPEFATANVDVRLVAETKANVQLQKIRNHIEQQGYYVIDRLPTDEERRSHEKIAKFSPTGGINAFRTDPDSAFGKRARSQLANAFGAEPVVIRTMGGTVPIIPLIDALNVPTLIVPMVNMDNNQHSPNENIRIGNMRVGIGISLSLLTMDL